MLLENFKFHYIYRPNGESWYTAIQWGELARHNDHLMLISTICAIRKLSLYLPSQRAELVHGHTMARITLHDN